MTPEQVEGFAESLWGARRAGTTLSAGGAPALTLDDAYAVQAALLRRRRDRGEQVVGWKLGYTSAAMREQMGIREPNWGALTDAMLLGDGAVLPESVLQPRVEPEVAVELAADLPAGSSVETAERSLGRARACLEVVDSVWTDYCFSLEQNTADGSSAAFVVLGPPLQAWGLDAVEVRLRRNGVPAGRGRGADAMGHPLAGLCWLADELAGRGTALRAGDLVITGGLTAAVPLAAGDTVVADFDGVPVSVRRGAA